ncbi:hypothetical protein [Novosphingobium sp.]|uniref:hypothetical protein n=1 Tax=Novosphingobium sp. TaxID=1874826 RepID=UPI002FE1846A
MSEQDSAQDPAKTRFAIIQLVRIFGVACVIAGMAIGANKFDLPLWVGYLLIINGLIDVFVVPKVLARKWRTPK